MPAPQCDWCRSAPSRAYCTECGKGMCKDCDVCWGRCMRCFLRNPNPEGEAKKPRFWKSKKFFAILAVAATAAIAVGAGFGSDHSDGEVNASDTDYTPQRLSSESASGSDYYSGYVSGSDYSGYDYDEQNYSRVENYTLLGTQGAFQCTRTYSDDIRNITDCVGKLMSRNQLLHVLRVGLEWCGTSTVQYCNPLRIVCYLGDLRVATLVDTGSDYDAIDEDLSKIQSQRGNPAFKGRVSSRRVGVTVSRRTCTTPLNRKPLGK